MVELELSDINEDNNSLTTNFTNNDNHENEKNVNDKSNKDSGIHNANKHKLLIDLAQLNICEILIDIPFIGKGYGTGFLCQIPDPDNNNKFIIVLLTCYHVLKIEKKNDYNFLINGSNNNFIEIIYRTSINILNLNNRKIWVNKDMDYTCIEIKKQEYEIKDNMINKLDISKDFNEKKYEGISTEIFGIMKKKNFVNNSFEMIEYSTGKIKKIYEDKLNKNIKYILYNNCSLNGFSGGPIYNIDNNMVLGIHKGMLKKEEIRIGILMKAIVEDIKNNNNFFYFGNEKIGKEGLKVM